MLEKWECQLAMCSKIFQPRSAWHTCSNLYGFVCQQVVNVTFTLVCQGYIKMTRKIYTLKFAEKILEMRKTLEKSPHRLAIRVRCPVLAIIMTLELIGRVIHPKQRVPRSNKNFFKKSGNFVSPKKCKSWSYLYSFASKKLHRH